MSYLAKEKLSEYLSVKRDAKRLSELEMDMRKEICAEALSTMIQNGDVEAGTVKGKFIYEAQGIQIKFSLPTTTKVDEEALDDDWSILEQNEKDCFKEKTGYSLDKKKFDAAKKAAEDDESVTFRVEEYLSEKPSAPTIDVDLF